MARSLPRRREGLRHPYRPPYPSTSVQSLTVTHDIEANHGQQRCSSMDLWVCEDISCGRLSMSFWSFIADIAYFVEDLLKGTNLVTYPCASSPLPSAPSPGSSSAASPSRSPNCRPPELAGLSCKPPLHRLSQHRLTRSSWASIPQDIECPSVPCQCFRLRVAMFAPPTAGACT
ncbi:hypothetical protein L226DRAFT_251421 [Lentinus tigrinus ALCF2SS1-7]|uniref:uncharacterized protein n=1 Tax=Lentinus tigrinus ALCF2SS1-7 TaxID=1328758 RepID=UPI0011663FF3|nr:hypothetical protein L226DRAFT_251421 [Lentinus tigrinus ALCF2SS1-7]